MQKLCRKDIASIDLNKGLVRSYCGTVLATGDNMANCFGVEIYRNGEAVNVDGYAVTGYFIYQNGAETIVVKGKAEGNTAIVELPQACYAHEGGFSLTIKVSGTDVTAAVRVIDGNIRQTATETLIDPGEVVPSLDELFAHIERMETATAEAEAAATSGAPPIVADHAIYNGGSDLMPNVTGAAVGRPLQGLRIFGKTTQDGTPTPEAPVDLLNIAEGGSITANVEKKVYVSGEESDGLPASQPVTVSIPGGMHGLPVQLNGTYTDASLQEWICDEIDMERGVYIQRCGVRVFDGTSGTPNYYNGHCRIMTTGQSEQSAGLCDKLPYKTAAYASGGMSNNGICFSVPGSVVGCSSTEEWSAWLAANPLTVVYLLKTPIETALTEDEVAAYKAIRMHASSTVSNDAGADMLMSVMADTKSYVDNAGGGAAAAPVQSVNGKTGDVVLTAEDVGAEPEQGKWELIETITLAEDVTAIERTALPDGTAYSLSAAKVIAKFYHPIPASIGTEALFLAAGQKLGTLVVYIQANTEATERFHDTAIYQAKPVAGVYEFIGAMGLQGGQMNLMYPSNGAYQSVSTAQKIDQINIVTWQHILPAGTAVEIWGVRADA